MKQHESLMLLEIADFIAADGGVMDAPRADKGARLLRRLAKETSDLEAAFEDFADRVVRMGESSDPSIFRNPSFGDNLPAMGDEHINVQFMVVGSYGVADPIHKAIRAAKNRLGRTHMPAGKVIPIERSPVPEPPFTDWARCALLWLLWHHQGHNSHVGQTLRFALGMGRDDRLTEGQIADAKAYDLLQTSAQRDTETERKKP